MHFFISVGNLPPQQRPILTQVIQAAAGDWFNYTTDLWIVCTDISCVELDRRLRAAIGPSAYMMMFDAEQHVNHAQLPEDAWRWLKRHGLAGPNKGG